MMAEEGIKISCCYSPYDELFQQELVLHLSGLRQQKLIENIEICKIDARTSWENEIKLHLNKVDIVLLLVGPSFLGSEEAQVILTKYERNRKVVFVLLHPIQQRKASLKMHKILPTNMVSVIDWPDIDDAFVDIARSIHGIIQDKNSVSNLPSQFLGNRPFLRNEKIKVLFVLSSLERESLSPFSKLQTFYNLLGKKNSGLPERMNRYEESQYGESDNIEIYTLWAATSDDLQRVLQEENFQIVHLSGYTTESAFTLKDAETGQHNKVSWEKLKELFSTKDKETMHCVILNACYPLDQIQQMKLEVPCIIATDATIEDKSVSEFTKKFYKYIGNKRNFYGFQGYAVRYMIEQAYEVGMQAVKSATFGEFKIVKH